MTINNPNKLILGTVQFGMNYGINNNSKPKFSEIEGILDMAYYNGIRTLDSAEDYGLSLDIISEFHKRRDFKFKIINKINEVKNHKSISQLIISRLNQLKIESFYAVFFHSSDYFLKNERLLDDLVKLKVSGNINKIGVSVYTNQEALDIINNFDIDIIQLPFNLLDNNNKRSLLFKKLKDKKIEIHARSIFLQGLFLDLDQLPKYLKELKPFLVKINDICVKMNISKSALALNYAIKNSFIDNVVIGVDNERQLHENIRI